jgi:hypothetical protein
MGKFVHRLRLCFRGSKIMSFYFLKQLTLMGMGRWLFRKAHNCYTCGSPAVVGYSPDGLYCSLCSPELRKRS